MKKKLQKSLIGFLALVILASTVLVPVANAAWWNPNVVQFAQKVGTNEANGGSPQNEIFGERYTLAQINWIINSLVMIIGGPLAVCTASDPLNIPQCLIDSASANSGGGPFLAVAGAIDSFQFNRPISGVDYVAQKLDKLNIVNTANAQEANGGYGFNSALQPIQGLWVASRNAAYALSTIAILILAFMIMFRQKISPQAVVTAQSALPKLAIALIGITFSYAIAGFMVDLAYVVQGLIAATISAAGISTLNPVQIFEKMNDGVRSMLSYAVGFIVTSLSGGGILAKGINLGNDAGGVLVRGSVFAIIDTFLAIIITLLLLISMLRILWLMIQTYGKFVFLVIAGPFVALLSVVNVGGGIGGWVKGLISELAVFISIGVIILFAHILFFSFGNGNPDANNGVNFVALGNTLGMDINTFDIRTDLAVEGNGRFPSGFSFSDTAAIGFFVSLAIIMSVPKLASGVRDQIKTGRGSYGFAVGETIKPARGLAGSAMDYQMADYVKNVGGPNNTGGLFSLLKYARSKI